ncbi:MAG: hypothetical protein JO327_06020 [Nitrososphaeraceae archaeon]|nr:hypothetical protein [Nitrososphaeraceae archaeon]MBV9667670.1 hypothetical protein [Nitrososphaeraceae archaeon]
MPNVLLRLEEAKDKGLIPDHVYQLITSRFHLVKEGISRIEKASGLNYPYYYVEPNLVVSTSKVEFTQFGIFFARTIPVVGPDNRLNILVQLTAPLISYGLLGTIHAILAHEFMHYISLISRVLKMNIISDEIPDSLFEEKYRDFDHLLEARIIFKRDNALINHIKKKFSEGLGDPRLERKAIEDWMNKGLPTMVLPVDANIIRIPIEAIAKLHMHDIIREKINQFENKARSKKSYV